ncbi:MAG: SPOR domain-containing protein [Alphaproteobacteria bacterium]
MDYKSDLNAPNLNGPVLNGPVLNGPGGFYGNGTTPAQSHEFSDFNADLGSYKGPEPVYAVMDTPADFAPNGMANGRADDRMPVSSAAIAATSGNPTGGTWRLATFVAFGVLLSVGLGFSFSKTESVVLAEIPTIGPGNLEERVRPDIAGGMFVPDRNMAIMNGNIETENMEQMELQANAQTLQDMDKLDDNVLVPTPVSFHPEPDNTDDATIGDLLNQLQSGDAWTEGRLLQRRLGLNLASVLKDASPDPFAELDRELSSRIQAPAAIVEAAKQAALEEVDEVPAVVVPQLLETAALSMNSGATEPVVAGREAVLVSASANARPVTAPLLALPSFGRVANIEPVFEAKQKSNLSSARTKTTIEPTASNFGFTNDMGLSFSGDLAFAEPTVAPSITETGFTTASVEAPATTGFFNPTRMKFFGQVASVEETPLSLGDDFESGFEPELGLDGMQFAAAGETSFVPMEANMLDNALIDELNLGAVEVAQLNLDGQGTQPIFDAGAPLPPLVEEVEAEIDRMNQGINQQNALMQQQQQMGLEQQQLGLQQQAALDQARAAAGSNAAPADSPFGDAPIGYLPEVPEGLTSAAVGNPFAIQLASVRSQAKAEATWQRVQRRFPEMLGDMVMNVEKAKVRGKMYYRVQAGPVPNRITGADICATLKANRQDCIVAKRK